MTTATNISTIGILGAGKLGTVVAQLALDAGYKVYIAGSGSPEKIALSVKVITPGATATHAVEAINKSDVVLLALPLSKYPSLPVDDLAGKLVIDAMNYWWEVDGDDATLKNSNSTSSELVQKFLPKSRVIKALSHMGYHHLRDEARSVDQPGRKAIAIAGGSKRDAKTIANLVNNLGFDPVHIGPLSRGDILEPGGPLFGANTNAKEIRQAVTKNSNPQL